MIGRAVDRMVSWFDPLAAAKRQHARTVYENGINRAYDAAKSDRRTSARRQNLNQSADLEMYGDADVMRAGARDLVRNNAYARGVLKAITRNVIGTGIQPQCRVAKARGKQNDAFNESAESLWRKWQQRADVTGRLSFYEMQSLILWEVAEAGECLVRYVRSNDRSRALPFALELVEADRLASDNYYLRNRAPDSGNEIRRGVELDSEGRPVAYWLYRNNPNDTHSTWSRPERHPADEFVHLFRQERIGQTRGLTWFAPVLRWARDLHYYLDNELQASAVASCFSVAIKSVGGPADGAIAGASGTESQDTNGNTFERIEPALVARLFPDEDISVINPSRGQSDATAWINLMLRSIAVGTGLSYERLTRDYSETNYSSNRASDLEDRREFRPLQDWLICHLCIPVWHKFLASSVTVRAKGFPSVEEFVANYDRWTEHAWQAPGWEWVDPEKEANASISAMENNLTTLRSELAKRGESDWRDVIRQRVEEKAYQQEVETEFGIEAEAEETEEVAV